MIWPPLEAIIFYRSTDRWFAVCTAGGWLRLLRQRHDIVQIKDASQLTVTASFEPFSSDDVRAVALPTKTVRQMATVSGYLSGTARVPAPPAGKLVPGLAFRLITGLKQ